ncbi:MAG TPA: ankyrin repeat domain-containing protein [Candidatus Limnocylindria bacterium]|jgi:ankyrin repeat protein|nr:ankyrin repeat domain-containing protein [Candidatus Limnocylindria bacterium]
MASELFAAIKGGDTKAVERLLDTDRGLVDARNETGLSPVLAALYRGKNDIATAILRRGPKLTVFEAAAAGDLSRVRELVERDRAQANAVAPDGYSPLGLAAFFRRSDVAAYLLERGADPRAPSRQGGFTPLHSAVATDAAPTDVELVRKLLDAGADPNARSESGGTPLHTTAFTGDRTSMELLLERGGDASIKNVEAKTAAEIARERGHPELARLLEDRLAQR